MIRRLLVAFDSERYFSFSSDRISRTDSNAPYIRGFGLAKRNPDQTNLHYSMGSLGRVGSEEKPMTTPQLTNEPWDEHLIRYGMPFAPGPIAKARGTLLWDTKGREILDFTSGQMCATIGHNHPRIVEAIGVSCEGALHLFSGMLSPPVVALSQRLATMLPPRLSKSLFLSTGGEANEAALKLAKLYTGRFEVVGYTGSWHGMTSGAQSVNYVAGRKGYGPLMPGSLTLPAPNSYHCPVRHCRDACDGSCLAVGLDMVDAQSTGSLTALIAEPVESSGGVIVPPDGYWQKVKSECEKRGMLLIFDEAQTAFGRLGCDFAFQHFGVEPDMLTLSKTLAGGLPLSATVISDAMEEACHAKGSCIRPRTSPTRSRPRSRSPFSTCWLRRG
jgi:2,2-dialkylglycine decarboxylase (pyruvate)